MENKEQHFWNRVIEVLRNNYSQAVLDYFVVDARLIEIRDQTVFISLDRNKQIFWNENNLQNIINLAGLEIYGTPMEMAFVDQSYFSKDDSLISDFQPSMLQDKPEEREVLPQVQSNLNPNFTFKNYIQGAENRWAFSAAQAIVNNPGQVYNPLFIWGGPGLGKTHLLNAIGNEILNKNPHARVKFITTENFVNDFINHLRHDKMDLFKRKYRSLDVLLIDDIQSLSKKESTIEEFFHTFNELHENEKQIVLTSDRDFNDLNDLPERLVTRFNWGLPVQVSPPDYETRVAILTSKIEEKKFSFNFRQEAIEYLASQFHSNVRELEGALNAIQIVADYQRAKDITIDLVAEAIRVNKKENGPSTNIIQIDQIQSVVSNFYGVTIKDIKGTKRPQNIVMARQVAMYLAREMTDNSLPKIGKAFGGRDHSTVLHACNKIKNMVARDESLELEIENIKNKLL